MQRASHLINDAARTRINAAVAAAESQTSAEIVPVIATSSGRYDRAEDLAGLCLAILLVILFWMLFQAVDPDIDGWAGPHWRIGLAELVIIIAGGFIIGALITSHVGWLRRLFTPRAEMLAEVEEKARQVFFDQRIHHTRSGGGVLLYVSLFERTAVVIADETVTQRLGAPAIDELCTQLTTRLRGGDVVASMEQTIAALGAKLSPSMPRSSSDVNELADAVVTID
jgi:putative membrane protein